MAVTRLLPLVVLLAGTAAFAAPAADPLGAAGSVPSPEHPFGWRGDGTGRFPGATPPLHWAADKNVRWSAVVGAGYSSPVLADKCVIVSAEPDLLICLDRADGKERWRLKSTPAGVPDEAGRKAAAKYALPKDGAGMAAATPVTDGRAVYVVYANGIVRAVGLDGKPKWTTCIVAAENTGYGRAASPLLVGGRLIVHMTGLYAFDAETGKQLWVNADAVSTYATPAAAKIGADDVIVTPSGDVVRAGDGKGLAATIGSTRQASPVVGDDGTIYFPSEPISAVRLGPNYKDEEVWSATGPGETFGSPLVVDGTAFITAGNGKLSAYDAKGKGSIDPLIEGRELFEGSDAGPVAYASLTLAGKYLFFTSNKGEAVVLEATREAKEVARNRLPAGSGASPVFSGKDLFLRAGDRLYCIGE